ncbi:hypothetical protein K488DRAFT_82548 [Vararia minispora EC-137]|uniref:Uncharacterized protein n=1 Tax=Vararia minispora EC-137 TaxID=1314806 RepID=A0ACB8QVQ0_9AGAM|nr:hypothetical protein K488DRAFT_82548 [Vararia minispora EC-137]
MPRRSKIAAGSAVTPIPTPETDARGEGYSERRHHFIFPGPATAHTPTTNDRYLSYEAHSQVKKPLAASSKPKAHAKAQVNHAATKEHDSPAVKAAAVPAPVPDTGADPQTDGPVTRSIVSLPTVQPTPTALADILAPVTTYIPSSSAFNLNLVPSPTITTDSPILPTSDATSPSTTSKLPSRHLSAAIISLVAVGAVFICFALCIVVRTCTRPRKRVHPTPSLPILQEDSPAEKGGDESPLFGGQERFSRASAGGPWTWTQYQSGVPKDSSGKSTLVTSATARSIALPAVPFTKAFTDQDATIHVAKTAVFAQPVAQTVTHSDGRIKYKSRLSTATLSEQPASSADYVQNPEVIGVAVSGEELAQIAYASSGSVARIAYDVSTTTLARSASERGQRANAGPRAYDARRSTFHGGSPRDGLAYVTSPPLAMGDGDAATPVTGRYVPGRARIKAPYGAGSYLRTSVSTSAAGTSRAYSGNPFEDAGYVVPPLPPMPQGGRTDALAAALGLIGPTAVAAPLTPSMLYPDDSRGVANDKKQRAPVKRGRVPPADVGSPTTEATSAALGELMMSTMSPGLDREEDGGAHEAAGVRRRADDKPPRVPSPPPLPSLAQMALANEGGFGDYRSPTYSIYGLYDPDRRSRVEG